MQLNWETISNTLRRRYVLSICVRKLTIPYTNNNDRLRTFAMNECFSNVIFVDATSSHMQVWIKFEVWNDLNDLPLCRSVVHDNNSHTVYISVPIQLQLYVCCLTTNWRSKHIWSEKIRRYPLFLWSRIQRKKCAWMDNHSCFINWLFGNISCCVCLRMLKFWGAKRKWVLWIGV